MEQFTTPSIVPTSAPTLRRPVSAEDWEDQRRRIHQLYCTENKPLDEVMDVMKNVHGFLATYVPFSLPTRLIAIITF